MGAARGNPSEAWAPHGDALWAYQHGDTAARLVIHDDYGDRDGIDASYFFRSAGALPPLETLALNASVGRILDLGAGAGAHSLALQRRGADVVAVEPVRAICDLLRSRGVERVVCGELGGIASRRVTTALLLMNGLGVAGSLAGLDVLLDDLRRVLAPGGQILADSIDVRAAYAPGDTATTPRRGDGRYVGEVTLQLEFGQRRGHPFPYLYVDPETLEGRACRAGWRVATLGADEDGTYLVRMTREE